VFRDIFPDSPIPNKLTLSSGELLHDTGTLHWVASNMRLTVNVCITEHGRHFGHLIIVCCFFDFNVMYFLTNRTCVRNVSNCHQVCNFLVSWNVTNFPLPLPRFEKVLTVGLMWCCMAQCLYSYVIFLVEYLCLPFGT
jgi:hypothetical protein